jgi:hypothetical protein
MDVDILGVATDECLALPQPVRKRTVLDRRRIGFPSLVSGCTKNYDDGRCHIGPGMTGGERPV